MTKKTFRAFLAMGALAAASASVGCVADRPSRNGVFNENQYLRKDFLIRDGDGTTTDQGWFMKATIVATSQPNPLAALGFSVGQENGALGGVPLVRFEVTQDHLNLLNVREISQGNPTQGERIPEVVNTWPVTNVDLKYQINLDGEKTNYYQENQELDWQVRQWVKINFAKNDLSDVAPMGESANYYLSQCADLGSSSATLVPDTFQVDETNNYMQWTVRVTVPVGAPTEANAATCAQVFGDVYRNLVYSGHSNVTFDLAYSFVRAKPLDPTNGYQAMVIDEKDPIQRKYGPIYSYTIDRDPNTQLLASRQLVRRFDPTKPIVWYFAPGYPEAYKDAFLAHGGMVDQTNQLLAQTGVAARLVVLNYDDAVNFNDHAGPKRYVGDIRYSFLRYMDSLDTGQTGILAFTQWVSDPRTGETISSSINVFGNSIKDFVSTHTDLYLAAMGATNGLYANGEWPTPSGSCQDGDVMPILPQCVPGHEDPNNPCPKNQNSTLYYEMQKALNRPAEQAGPLGPVDFVAQQDDDFRRGYFALLPYLVFRDPATNLYVTPEGQGGVFGAPTQFKRWQDEVQFQQMAANIDHGIDPYQDVTGPTGLKSATDFANTMRTLTLNHNDLQYSAMVDHPWQMNDDTGIVSLQSIFEKDARHCIADASGATHWETKQEWLDGTIRTYWDLVVMHEFGHALGLDHNFMASVDQPNYPHYKDRAGRDHVGMYQSSIMEYNQTADRIFWYVGNDDQGTPIRGWGPYDKAALSWIYGNTKPAAVPTDSTGTPLPAQGISGQVSPTAPWNDKFGFTPDGKEVQFLFCNADHQKYTPLCRTFDTGATPSEIIANMIDGYEFNYQFRNFRQYYKFWDDAAYANGPAAITQDMKKFISMWAFDWNTAELQDTFRRIGVTNPDPNGSAANYYDQLTNKFTKEASAANSMVAAFHQAVIQQSSGERPFRTIYDKYYGDVTQQGIILDKYFAMQGFVGLWPTDNYDQNQAGSYIASYAGLGESFYDDVAQQVVTNMVGGGYDVYPWFVPTAVALYAQDTHNPAFSGRIDARDWIGGKVFTRLQDFLDYFRDIAVKNNYVPWSSESSTAVTAAADGAVVSLSMPSTQQITIGEPIVIDAGDQIEETRVLNITPTTITVQLTKAHTGTYPITAEPCTDVSTCAYDPRGAAPQGGQLPGEFLGPDRKRWIYAYIPDRNTWLAVERERNTATYIIVHNYNLDIMTSNDDGSFPGNAYGDLLPMKYTLDAFGQYN